MYKCLFVPATNEIVSVFGFIYVFSREKERVT